MTKKIGWYDDARRVRYGLPEDTMARYHEGIRKLTEELFEEDEDADMPVSVRVVDRTMTGPLHYEPMPLAMRMTRREEFLDAIRVAALNVELAAGDMRAAVNHLRYFEDGQAIKAVKSTT